MPPKPDKFGSPYDPKNKMPKPEKEGQKGDFSEASPKRTIPVTRIVSADLSSTFVGFVESTRYNGATYERIREQMLRSLHNLDPFAYTPSLNPASPPPRTPPASYNSAKSAVAQWLSVAPEQAFSDIVGNDEALALLRDAIEAPVTHKELYSAYNLKMPKGALLSGPPGCGKTMFARAAASEMKRLYGGDGEFICISGGTLQAKYIGVTEERIIAIFRFAKEYKAYHGRPLLIFIDEAEVLFPDRTGRVRRVYPWEESQVATFLAEMDGVTECGAFVLLATNRPEVMDQALLRDGRCDFKITVRRPNFAAVETILRNNFSGTLTEESDPESLVNAALESLFDPHKVIAEAHTILANFETKQLKEGPSKHFLLEHIISGAMVASIPARATRLAFARDKVSGTARGVTVENVLKAVNDLFQENLGLDHSFAREEFQRSFEAEMRKELK